MHAVYAAEGVTHRYQGVMALAGVTFGVRGGEIHALVGENGAGKSTLVRVLTGALVPTAGRLTLDGEEMRVRAPRDAQRRGVAVVHQDEHLFRDLSVAHNVAATGTLPPRRGPFVDRRGMRRRAVELLRLLDIDVDAGRLAGTLDAAERKLVAIARALVTGPRFLVLDEPTAALESHQTDRLCRLLDRLRAEGTGLVVVTHDLDDVLRLADRVTVLRDGRQVAALDRAELSSDVLVAAMLGEARAARPQAAPGAAPAAARAGDPVLQVSGLRLRPGSAPVALDLHAGEVVGVVGLVGSGAATLVRRLGGAVAQPPAEIRVRGRRVRIRHAADAVRAGMGFVSEDRKRAGVVPERSVAENTALATLRSVATLGFRRDRRLRRLAEDGRRRFDIRCASLGMPVAQLSGGNQQKVLLARWLLAGASVLLVEEPTQGVDVGARAELHEQLRAFARGGGALLFASSDLDEVLRLSDRVAVVHDGELTVLPNHEGRRLDRGELLRRVTGLEPEPPEVGP